MLLVAVTGARVVVGPVAEVLRPVAGRDEAEVGDGRGVLPGRGRVSWGGGRPPALSWSSVVEE